VSHEIITVAQMRAVDAACASGGMPTQALMDNAGRAVAAAISKRFTPRKTAVICGPGNNGGDGWVAARVLKEMGWPVWVESLVARSALGDEAAVAAATWDGETKAPGEANAELYVDAMFGAGLSRPLEGHAAERAAAMAAHPERVVAVDVPSGLAGDTAKPIGDKCARATLTVTFVRKKPAHVLLPGRAFCGEVVVADIGAPDSVVAAQNVTLFENAPSLWGAVFPWPRVEAHKHARGHVVVASGPHGHTGAARLAARGALRIGAGLVTVLSPPPAMAENAAQLTAIMLREAGLGAYAQAARDAQAMVIGPAFGVDKHHGASLADALGASLRCPLVLDADAITLLSPLMRKLGPRDVLTPHVGEFKRAFGDLLDRMPTRIEAAREASRQAGCTVLLKGPDTVIAAPDGRAIVNTTGTPFLATAGAGDVLAGFISGLIAQGMASFEAAAAAAWLHGKCAEAFGPGLIAEDLPEILPRAIKDLTESGALGPNGARSGLSLASDLG
jgi:hydroxyethylthiazole kinase-like uncharacterized protein yjeF